MTAVNICILSVPLYITHLLQLYYDTHVSLCTNLLVSRIWGRFLFTVQLSESGDSHSDLGGFGRTFVGHLSVWSPTKLSVRPECLIVDTLGGICSTLQVYQRSDSHVRHILHTGKKVRLQIRIDHKMFDIFTSRNVKEKSFNIHSHVRPKCPTK
jgi:hypothetical protein